MQADNSSSRSFLQRNTVDRLPSAITINDGFNALHQRIQALSTPNYLEPIKYLGQHLISIIQSPFYIYTDDELSELFLASFKQNIFFTLLPQLILITADNYLSEDEESPYSPYAKQSLQYMSSYLTIRNIIFNVLYMTAISGSFPNKDTTRENCNHCEFSLSSELTLNLNYIFGYKLNALLLSSIPNSALSFFSPYYTVYTFGNGLLDYPLSKEGACAQHREHTNTITALSLGFMLFKINQLLIASLSLSETSGQPLEKLLLQIYLVAVCLQPSPQENSRLSLLAKLQPVPLFIKYGIDWIEAKIRQRIPKKPPDLKMLGNYLVKTSEDIVVCSIIYLLFPELWFKRPKINHKATNDGSASTLLISLVSLYPLNKLWTNIIDALNNHLSVACNSLEKSYCLRAGAQIVAYFSNQSAKVIKSNFNIPLSLSKMIFNFINEFPDVASAFRQILMTVNHYEPLPTARKITFNEKYAEPGPKVPLNEWDFCDNPLLKVSIFKENGTSPSDILDTLTDDSNPKAESSADIGSTADTESSFNTEDDWSPVINAK